ncbi:reverse transcriptase domain-containing protein [Tanacetum coccineum]
MILELLEADYRRQRQLTEALKLVKSLQTQMEELQRQQGPAKGPARRPTVEVVVVPRFWLLRLAARNANTNGVDSHNSGTYARRNEQATRECTYPDFMKCRPLNFKGTEGVFELTQWFEKMEIVFRISNYFVENQIKFSTCTLLGNALTWWNSHIRTVGNDITYAMTWTELKKKITDKYCPRTEIKKLEVELWELKVKDMIHGSVVASKPKTMQEATKNGNRRTLAEPTLQDLVKGLLALSVEFGDTSRKECRAEEQQQLWFQVGGGNAPAMVYAVRAMLGTNQDSTFGDGYDSF